MVQPTTHVQHHEALTLERHNLHYTATHKAGLTAGVLVEIKNAAGVVQASAERDTERAAFDAAYSSLGVDPKWGEGEMRNAVLE